MGKRKSIAFSACLLGVFFFVSAYHAVGHPGAQKVPAAEAVAAEEAAQEAPAPEATPEQDVQEQEAVAPAEAESVADEEVPQDAPAPEATPEQDVQEQEAAAPAEAESVAAEEAAQDAPAPEAEPEQEVQEQEQEAAAPAEAESAAEEEAAQDAPAPEAEPEQEVQENLFTLHSLIVKDLEKRLDEEKFAPVSELKDKEFSEAGLAETLKTAGLSAEEIDTVLNIVKEAVKAAAPVALAIDKAETELQAQKELFAETQIDEEKKKISADIRQLGRQLRNDEYKLSQIMDGVDGGKVERVASVLQEAEYEGDEAEIISKRLLDQSLFAKKLRTLTEMAETISTITEEIRDREKRMNKAGSEEEKKNHARYLTELNDRLKNTKNDFSVLTTGIDYDSFLKKEGKEVEWDKELKEIFSPIIVELKETTERPRKMERLRSDIMYFEKRIPQVQKASADLNKFLQKARDRKVRARLKSWKDYWDQLEKEFTSQLEADKSQLLQLENERKSLLASFKVFFDSFIKHRGKSLIEQNLVIGNK